MYALKVRHILSVPVTAGNQADVVKAVFGFALKAQSVYVCVANVHMVVEAVKNKKLFSVIQNAALVVTDGMPLVWELKHQGVGQIERVPGPDLMVSVCEEAQQIRLPVYFFGGSKKTSFLLEKNLKKRFPDLEIAGCEPPPMLPELPILDQMLIGRIRDSGARIVFVGLGCPKQEYWMSEYAKHLPAVLIGVGAAFDFFAGTKKRAPLWMQNSGLEWLFRLFSEPRRLWKRYFFTNILFIWYRLRGI